MKKYGILFSIGGLVQILTSSIWQSFPVATGENIYIIGQLFGELCYLICCMYFLRQIKVFWCIAGFFVDLCSIDLVDVIFFNPFELHISKFIGFSIAFCILLIRVKRSFK